MKKQWFFDRYCGVQFAVLVEDNKLAEILFEEENSSDVVGNVYVGEVTNVLAGMNAAFINCGLEKNCYLSLEESYTDYTKYDGSSVATTMQPLSLKVGDQLLVQVVKPPRGNKGAKVTTHISLVGRRLVYLPRTDFLGISRKITDEAQREKYLKLADELRVGKTSEGFIIRTQAPFATDEQLKREAKCLQGWYAEILERAQNAAVGSLVYQEEELHLRVLRDSFGDETTIYVAEEELYQKLLPIISTYNLLPKENLIYYSGKRSLIKEYGISTLINEALSPRVKLENGGYLVIDHTEAMTVIDVNTGSYVGKDSLEETVFDVNRLAAIEIARQVRLRNISGIVVVDFIDMVDEEHCLAVNAILEERLSADKAKCNVLPMSEFCITQFTRKRVGDNFLFVLLRPCPHCLGTGYEYSDFFVLARIRSNILDCFADGNEIAVVEANERIVNKIIHEKTYQRELATRWKGKQVYLIANNSLNEGSFARKGEKGDFTPPTGAILLQ